MTKRIVIIYPNDDGSTKTYNAYLPIDGENRAIILEQGDKDELLIQRGTKDAERDGIRAKYKFYSVEV